MTLGQGQKDARRRTIGRKVKSASSAATSNGSRKVQVGRVSGIKVAAGGPACDGAIRRDGASTRIAGTGTQARVKARQAAKQASSQSAKNHATRSRPVRSKASTAQAKRQHTRNHPDAAAPAPAVAHTHDDLLHVVSLDAGGQTVVLEGTRSVAPNPDSAAASGNSTEPPAVFCAWSVEGGYGKPQPAPAQPLTAAKQARDSSASSEQPWRLPGGLLSGRSSAATVCSPERQRMPDDRTQQMPEQVTPLWKLPGQANGVRYQGDGHEGGGVEDRLLAADRERLLAAVEIPSPTSPVAVRQKSLSSCDFRVSETWIYKPVYCTLVCSARPILRAPSCDFGNSSGSSTCSSNCSVSAFLHTVLCGELGVW